MAAKKLDPAKESRLARGRTREDARFTAPPSLSDLPESYGATLEEIKRHLQQARVRSVLAANAVVIAAYWQTGQIILQRQQEQGWGAKVIDRLSTDLRQAFPGMEGLSARNLLSMKLLALAFPAGEIAKQPVSQLPWGHIIRLLQMVKEPAMREFYIRQTIAHGWSRSLMEMQIGQQLHLRLGQAQNNFLETLPPPDSDLSRPALSLQAMSASSISISPLWTTSCAIPMTRPPSACCCAGRKTNSLRNTPCAAWTNPSPSPRGRRN